jgi:hypothetical protein
MADAEFWRDLALKFRALPTDDGTFRIDWSTVVGKPGVKWTPFASDDTRVQFELLARRAGLALEPESRDFLLVWFSLLKESSASRVIRNQITLSIGDEGSHETVYGSIADPCGASAIRCSVLEVDSIKQVRGKITHLPNDTRTLLPQEALKRVDRAHVEADRFVWEAEALIDTQRLNRSGVQANTERNQGHLKKARFILSALQSEYSRLSLADSEYRLCINGEIEAASNSLELYDSQRRLLETEFFFQLETGAEPVTFPTGTEISTTKTTSEAATPMAESVAAQINRLREECRWTVETLAERLRLDARSVERHLAGKTKPRLAHVGTYEPVFSKALGRTVVISQMPVKRR